MLCLVLVGHVEEAEARQRVGFEQAFLQELLLDLLDLDGLHACRGRGRVRGSAWARRAMSSGFGRGGEECGEKFFFEDGEGAVEVFQVRGTRCEV